MYDPNQRVLLTNGEEVSVATLGSLQITLEFVLRTEGGQILSELKKKCLDPNYEISPESMNVLVNFGLIEGGYIHYEVKSIVLSCVMGVGDEVSIVDPIAHE